MQQLVLAAKEIAVSGGTLRWHWRLQASGGSYLADSPVKLQYGTTRQALIELLGPLPLADVSQWTAAPVTVRLAPLRGAEAALLASEFPA